MRRALVLGALLALVLAASSGAGKGPSTVSKPRWLAGVRITEYYSAPENWFVGRKVAAPGIPGKHRVDWLYSAGGVSMEGDGIGLDGLHYHLSAIGTPGWVTQDGKATAPGSSGWTGGSPFWRFGGWRNKQKAVTFPLEAGGWFDGKSVRYIQPVGVRFSPGMSLPLKPWASIAVDPSVIPMGSRVFVPAYCPIVRHGWMTAQDKGGAIGGLHIDVYRLPPDVRGEDLQFTGQRIFVIPPGAKLPAKTPKPTCATDGPKRRS
jgi:3D (Asp-Asp-Asp) domain-containing protein